MTRKFNIAIWGAGSWASICMRSIRQIPDLQIIGCYCRNPQNREAFARDVGCPAADSEDALLNLPGLDAMLIMTPNFLHHEHVLRAAARGLHIFVEKPMANTVTECRSMIEAARLAGVTLFVGHNSRRELRFRRMKKMLDEGVIGQPVMAEINYTSEAGLEARPAGWRYDTGHTPAVALAQIGIHAIDILHSMFGPPGQLQAWIQNVGMPDGILDVCLARLQFPRNLSATFLNAYSVPRIRRLSLMGTGGNLVSDVETSIEYRKTGSLERETILVEANNTIREEFEEFLICCREGRLPETGGPEGLAATAVMESMLRSASSGSRIEILEFSEFRSC